MLSIKSVSVVTVAIASCLVFLSNRAGAQTVSAYSDMWTADDANDNGTLTIYEYGGAGCDGDCTRAVGVQVVLYDPSRNQLAVEGARHMDFASAQMSYDLSDSPGDGDWDTTAAADYDFVHYDCSDTEMGLVSVYDNYFFLNEYTSLGVLWGNYQRCAPGLCQSLKIKRQHVTPSTGPWPQEATRHVLEITMFGATACFGLSGVPGSC
jgi:hypothetical protein